MKIKIELIHIFLGLTIILAIAFFVYTQFSTNLKLVEYEFSTTLKIEGEEAIQKEPILNKKGKMITCKLPKSYLKKEEYDNYILGKGDGYNLDLVILLKKNDKYYQVKTLQRAGLDESAYYFACYVKDDIDYEVFLYDKISKNLYKY